MLYLLPLLFLPHLKKGNSCKRARNWALLLIEQKFLAGT